MGLDRLANAGRLRGMTMRRRTKGATALRFTKWRETRQGRPVSKCGGMKRIKYEVGYARHPEDFRVEAITYRFECMSCKKNKVQWAWPSDGTGRTTQHLPLEVRLHVQLH